MVSSAGDWQTQGADTKMALLLNLTKFVLLNKILFLDGHFLG